MLPLLPLCVQPPFVSSGWSQRVVLPAREVLVDGRKINSLRRALVYRIPRETISSP